MLSDSERAKFPLEIPWLVPRSILIVLSIFDGCAIDIKLMHFKFSSYVVFGAAFGIILSAVYMLYLYKRIIFGTITNNKLADILDINTREKIILIPLAISVILLGIFPNLFLDPMRLSLELIITNYEIANAK